MSSHLVAPRRVGILLIGGGVAYFSCICGQTHTLDVPAHRLVVGTRIKVTSPCGLDYKLRMTGIPTTTVFTDQDVYPCCCGRNHPLPHKEKAGSTALMTGSCGKMTFVTFKAVPASARWSW